MAEGKKSFLFYADWIDTFKVLPKDKGYDLLMHLLHYVNDEEPETDDLLVNALFAQFRNTLKRDLGKYKETKKEKSDKGKLGNLKRWHVDLYDEVLKQKLSIEEAYEIIANHRQPSHSDKSIANIAVSDSVSVSVSDSVIDIKKKNINTRKQEFYNSLIPFLKSYRKEMVKEFFEYWSEHGEKDRKFRKEKEKSFNTELRLKTWFKRSKEYKQTTALKNKGKPMMLSEKMKMDHGLN